MAEDFLTSAFVRLRTVLKGRAGRVLGSEAAADDALQEAFYKLWQKGYALKSVEDAEALLSRAVQNAAIDEVRRRKRSRIEMESDEVDDSDVLDREQMLQSVKSLIESELNESQKMILRSRDIEGQSYEEIAEEMGMQETAVRMQLSRARKAIREKYRIQQRING